MDGRLVLFLLAASCGARATKVDLSDRADAVVFVAVLDEGGSIVRATDPVRIEAGQRTEGERPVLPLGEAENAVLVEISTPDLASELGWFWEGRVGLPRVRVGPPPASRTLDRDDDPLRVRVRVALPRRAILSDVIFEDGSEAIAVLGADSPETSAVRAGVTIELVADPEPCALPGPGLLPFAGERNVLASYVSGVDEEPRVRRVILVDSARALVAENLALLLVKRGEVFRQDPYRAGVPGNYLPTVAFGHGLVALLAAAVDRSSAEDGLRVLLGGKDQGGRGIIFEARLRPLGLEPVRTSTTVKGAVGDLSIDAGGRVVAAAEGGLVLLADPGASSFRASQVRVAESEETDEVAVAWTADPVWRVLLGTKGQLHLYDEARETWVADDFMLEPARLDVYAVVSARTAAGAVEMWAAGDTGRVKRRTGSAWAYDSMLAPPRASACTGGGGPFAELARTIEALAIDEEAVYAAPSECSAILRRRLADDCTSVILPDGEAARVMGDGYTDIDLWDGELLVGGKRGDLFVAGVSP